MASTRHHNLCYLSSPDRGLETLLDMWGEIRKRYPDAQLHVAYGWKVFDMVYHNNPERQSWKERIVKKMKAEGITDHGRLGKDELTKLRRQCGIWAYPTWFNEINCITALECQYDGVVPVTMNIFALRETVGSGKKVDGDIYEPEVQKKYLEALYEVMDNKDIWERESQKGKEFARSYDWSAIAKNWVDEFARKDESVKVSIYTPTIRRGFWRSMAKNISEQTYKNVEWIIVDDHEDDRSDIADVISKQYGLNIVYTKGKKGRVKRTYGLVNANNTALNIASGEIMVFLQDFVYMPLDGIEQIVKMHKDHPDALIALPDIYLAPAFKPDIESEDWWNGRDDFFGDHIRTNVRITNSGMRETQNPYDFEQNYGAIPVRIARDLGGWYEFMDEGLGYDNTDIAYRALKKGYKIILDETNVAICIDHWGPLQGTKDIGLGRSRKLNDPRYLWEVEMIERGALPIVRTQDIDDTIQLLYEIPDNVKDEDVVEYLRDNAISIMEPWITHYTHSYVDTPGKK